MLRPKGPQGSAATTASPPGCEKIRFPDALAARHVHVKEMYLVVTRRHRSIGRKQQRTVNDLVIRCAQGQRTCMEPDAKLLRQPRKTRNAGIVLFRGHNGAQALAVRLKNIGHLGREHILRALGCGVPDHGTGITQVPRHVDARTHLDEGCLETHVAIRSGSSPPRRSSSCSSSLPPTWVSPMKICGTLRRPLVRSIMRCRAAGSPLTSISSKLNPFFVKRDFAE